MKRIFDLGRAPAAAALALLAGTPARAAEAPPVAAAVHLDDEAERARLSFDVSAPLTGRARELESPDRIVLDLPEVDFRLSHHSATPKPDALIKAYRFGLFGPGKSRVVVDLARPACVAKVDTRRLVRNRAASRLTLELRSCSREAFAAAALEHAPLPVAAAPAPAPTAPKAGLPVIVLDP